MDNAGINQKNLIGINHIFYIIADCPIGIFNWHNNFNGGMPVRWIIFHVIIVIQTKMHSLFEICYFPNPL